MDVARSPPQEAHYHVGVMYSLPSLGLKNDALGLKVGSQPTGAYSRRVLLRRKCSTEKGVLHLHYLCMNVTLTASNNSGWY